MEVKLKPFDIAKLSVQDGDVLVIHTDEHMTLVPVMILSHGLELSVLRTENKDRGSTSLN